MKKQPVPKRTYVKPICKMVAEIPAETMAADKQEETSYKVTILNEKKEKENNLKS